MPVVAQARNAREVMDRFRNRCAIHGNDGAEKNRSKRKPRIFPLKDPNRHDNKEDHRPRDFTACGYAMAGDYISVPGFRSRYDALNYARGKNWRNAGVVAGRVALLLALAVFARPNYAEAQSLDQQNVIAQIAVDTVAATNCPGMPVSAATFSGLARTGMTIEDITATGGRFQPVMYAVVSGVMASQARHPVKFCENVARARRERDGASPR